jgi:type I restriction enzyme, S subunit
MSEELPEGWAETTIADVVRAVSNISPEEDPDRTFAYVDISAIDSATNTIQSTKAVRGKDAPSRARRPVQSGDVLFSNVRTYLRNIALVTDGVAADVCSTGFTVLRPTEAIASGYLFRYVLSEDFIRLTEATSTGTHYPATSDRAVMALPLPLPPLAEQWRIVAAVERILAEVGAARERLGRVPATLKRFRQSVLAAACSGRLTADWRGDGATSDELPAIWKVEVIERLLNGKPQNGLYKPQSDYGSGTHILRIDSYQHGRIVPWQELKRVRLSRDDIDLYRLENNDLIVNRVNSPIWLGKCALVRDLTEPCVFESNMMRLRLDHAKIDPEYAARYLGSLRGREQLQRNAKHAVNQSSINQGDVLAVEVPLPPLPEQREIVRRVSALFALADGIEAKLAAARRRVDALTQAVLAKAFRGELVPTEAELARREGRDYEPASALLERVRAEAGGATAPRRRRRT